VIPMLPWVEKYRPRHMKDIINQKNAIQKINDWIKSWISGTPKKKALLLAGPPGSGKTSTVYALANDYGFEVIELNASDERTLEKIKRYIGAAYTLDIFGRKRKLIFLDEADNMEPSGAREIAKLIENAPNPIILTANYYWKVPREIRNKALIVEYKRLTQRDIQTALYKILKIERIFVPKEVIAEIAKRASGDLRAAINDLQTVISGGVEDAVEVLAYRDVEKSVFQVLGTIFSTDNVKRARMASWNLDMMPNDLLLWIDENLPYVYPKPEDIARAYEALSRADIYLARAQRTGDYGLWKYATDMMSAGVAVAGIKKKGFLRFYPPKTIKILTESKEERSLRDSLIKKIMKEMHMAKLEAIETMRIFRSIFENNSEVAAHIAVFLDLGDKEIEFLAGDKEKAAKIKGKMLSIHRKLKERGELEEHVRVAVEAKKSEEELEKAEEEMEVVEEEPKEKMNKPKKKGKQATLFDFMKK